MYIRTSVDERHKKWKIPFVGPSHINFMDRAPPPYSFFPRWCPNSRVQFPTQEFSRTTIITYLQQQYLVIHIKQYSPLGPAHSRRSPARLEQYRRRARGLGKQNKY